MLGYILRRDILALLSNGVCLWFPGSITFGLVGLLVPTWAEMFGVGLGAVGLVTTFLILSLGISMYVAGKCTDKWGSRKVATIGSLASAVVLFCFAYVPNIYTLYAVSFLWGSAPCFIYIPALISAQKWFSTRRGMASGIIYVAWGMSPVPMIPLFSYWLKHLGYSLTIISLAAITAVIGVIFAQFIDFPETLNLTGKNGPQPMKVEATRKLDISMSLGEALKTRAFWLIFLTFALSGGAGAGMWTHSTSISLEMSLSTEVASVALAAFNTTNGLSRIISGVLSDKLERVWVMSLFFLAGGIGFFLLSIAGGNYLLVTLSNLLAGFTFGTVFAVSAPLTMDIFGAKHYGEIFGAALSGYSLFGSLLGPYVGGAVHDLNGSYFAVYLLFGIYCLISAILILYARPTRHSTINNRAG